MINKEDNKKPSGTKDAVVEVAKMDVQCHFIIRDKDTKQVIVNKRG